MTRVFAIRPQPGLPLTLARAAALGLDMAGRPLSEIRPLAWQPPPLAEIDGLLLGSANALRHGGAALGTLRGKPVYAVGEATARAARKAGFAVALTGPGVLQGVVDRLAGQELRLLRLAGREHVPLHPPAGIAVTLRVAYESIALPIPDEMAEALREGGVVLLHSAAAARHFGEECARLSIPRERLALAALGPRIAEAAGSGWAGVQSAAEPRDAALLALARDMCH